MQFSYLEKFGAAALAAVWLLWGSHQIGEILLPAPKAVAAPAKARSAAPAKTAASAASEPAGGDAMVLLAAATAKAGVKAFKKCKACHGTKKGGKHKIGPNLWDVVGRAKASAAGYKYSDAMTGAGGDWTYADLDAFLAKPKEFVPGTKMSFAGVKKAPDRAALIVFMRSLSDSPKPLP